MITELAHSRVENARECAEAVIIAPSTRSLWGLPASDGRRGHHTVMIAGLARFPSPCVGFCAGAVIMACQVASWWCRASCGVAPRSIKGKWSLVEII
ncbi:hypothetical protein [Pseudonocardia zijingensis]|uniref:Uncharacterized protein n=1 Tax=Pseudonocardia zijingensis TaxID=153376 RepID=A0ABP3YLH8_9PSEU